MRTEQIGWIARCVLAVAIAGCASAQTPAKSEPAKSEPAHIPAAPSNSHIYVSTDNLPGECYHDLGTITYAEPFTDSVIDPEDVQLNERLRELAREKYPKGLDAILNVQKNQNLVGTEVTVTGEAVTMRDNMTVECAIRDAPGVVDSTSRIVAGGIMGTMIGGLVGSGGSGSTTSAETGGALGALGAGTINSIEKNQAQQEAQADLDARIAAQQTRITMLRSELAKLVSAQCDRDELSPAECSQRAADIERQAAGAAAPVNPANTPGAAAAGAGGGGSITPIVSQFDVQNRLQAQQETIDRLERQIAAMKGTPSTQ